MPPLHVDKISLASFQATLSRYKDTAPPALSELDTLRYETIAAKLADMGSDASLQKADVERLVEWKLKHGTYRPSLLSLVKSNPAPLIKSTTHSAFGSLAHDNDALTALKLLTALRGIGPATASLLLSVFQPAGVPFFSDELFRWVCWGKEGWGRRIKYNIAEYKELLRGVERICGRLGVAAVEVERVAYVLGKEGVDVDVDVDVGDEERDEKVEDEDEDEDAAPTRVEKLTHKIPKQQATTPAPAKQKPKAQKKNTPNAASEEITTAKADTDTAKPPTKRKATEPPQPAEGVRRSTRRKP
ncbi:hypothetical protein N0V95_006275 [Ascochyta clinopodiicola]|nr:hypothetical protein N0V95_006275 [Ascochyta clinopodiicola]